MPDVLEEGFDELTTATKVRGAVAPTGAGLREWVHSSAAAQGLPAQIEDAGVYAQLAALILAGRQTRAAARRSDTNHASQGAIDEH